MSECPKNYTWACQLCSVPCKDYHISKPAPVQSEITFQEAKGFALTIWGRVEYGSADDAIELIESRDAQLIASTLQAAAGRVRHYTDDKAYNDAIDNAIVAILAPLNKMDEVEGNS